MLYHIRDILFLNLMFIIFHLIKIPGSNKLSVLSHFMSLSERGQVSSETGGVPDKCDFLNHSLSNCVFDIWVSQTVIGLLPS